MSGTCRETVIIPCSGIGKPFGSVSREAAYEVVDMLRPAHARLIALSRLVLGDDDARDAVARHPVVTIDGCKLACAAKMAKASGARRVRELAVIDTFRRHPKLKPEGIAELNDAGRQLARALAEEVAAIVDEQAGGEGRDA
ncbi:MAG: putative zinc-binding protein [Acidobacteria bacterium]|jgi:uncharacterized metal-binding protein|nr:putative zinc-binding protein [Acidobacteriota bacterium]